MNGSVTERRAKPEARQRFVLDGVAWSEYEQFLSALAEHHVRCTYDQGTLELLSVLPLHEMLKRWFGNLLGLVCSELRHPMKAMGSTTLRRRAVARGLDPDESFFVGRGWRLRDPFNLDLDLDPVPDLAVEVDLYRTRLDRLPIFAVLGVTEVWLFDGQDLRAFGLTGANYQPLRASRLLPFLPLAEVPSLILGALDGSDDRKGQFAIRDWLHETVRPRYEAWRSQQTPPQAP
jgi:Uma2 family endonuclease